MLIASRRVVLGGGEEALEIAPAGLRLEEGRIAEVRRLDRERYAEQLAAWAGPLGGEVQDCRDRLVTPAFVNAHTHLALGFLRGAAPAGAARGNLVRELYFDVEPRLSPEDVRAFVRMGAWESLSQGVGLVWDHYYHGLAVAEALAETGLGGVVAPTLQDLGGPGVAEQRRQLDATQQIAGSEELAVQGIFAAVGPHATDTVSASLWREAADVARRLQVPVHAHLAQSLEEVRYSLDERGTTPLRWLAAAGLLEAAPRTVFAHCLYVSRPELALLDPGRDVLVFCPCAQLVFGFPADPLVWEEAGAPWVVATDCSPSNDSMNLQKELRHVAGQRSVGATWSSAYRTLLGGGGAEAAAEETWRERTRLFERGSEAARPEALLRRVWSLPGTLHPGFRAGVLAAGALANLVVWDLDHPAFWPDRGFQALAMADTTQAIWGMWLAGREIGEAGDFQRSLVESDLYRAHLREAETRRRRILGT